jgi:hypothetical protein
LYPGREDEKVHFESLRSAFEDQRYIKVDGRPLFSIYVPHDLPNPTAFVEHWRELAAKAGFAGLYMVAITNHSDDPRFSEFDAVTPNGPSDFFGYGEHRIIAGIKRRVLAAPSANSIWTKYVRKGPRRLKYKDLVKHGLISSRFSSKFLPCIVPNWDNTPRSKYRGVVVEGCSPSQFREYFKAVCELIANRPPETRIVFLKAWNEWAEGNYVEPDNLFGREYLYAIESVLYGT